MTKKRILMIVSVIFILAVSQMVLGQQVITSYTFNSDAEGWEFLSYPDIFNEPGYRWVESGGLELTATTVTDTFGYYQGPADIHYRVGDRSPQACGGVADMPLNPACYGVGVVRVEITDTRLRYCAIFVYGLDLPVISVQIL